MPNGTIGDVNLLKKETVTVNKLYSSQRVAFGAVPVSGSFKLVTSDGTTGLIAYNDNAAAVKAAIDAVLVTESYSVTGSFASGKFDIVFGVESKVVLMTISTNTLKDDLGRAVAVTVTHTGGNYNTVGEFLEGVKIAESVVCNVQPVTGNELMMLPEGDRSRDVLNMWTKTLLTTEHIVTRGGKDYEVNNVEGWYGYYKCRLIGRSPA